MIERLKVKCPKCKGDGTWHDGWRLRTCPICYGKRVVPESDAEYIERLEKMVEWLASHDTEYTFDEDGEALIVHLECYDTKINKARIQAVVRATKGGGDGQ